MRLQKPVLNALNEIFLKFGGKKFVDKKNIIDVFAAYISYKVNLMLKEISSINFQLLPTDMPRDWIF